MSPYDVELINVTKEFAGRRGEAPVRAVDHISLQIRRGEFFALLGPSGCGKTTTLRMIAGFEDLTSGQILIGGRPMHNVPPFHRPVNTVFQDYALFPHMSALKNVLFGLEMESVSRKEAMARALQALEMVRLPTAANRKPKELSGGQQQRVALARALVKNPTVLLLDEPLGALDLKLRKAMQYELKEMQTRLGITFVYVTHDQEEALTMADRIAVMEGGRVLQIGSPEEIYEEPQTRFVADFIGETNFLTGTLRAHQADRAQVELADGQMVGALMPEPLAQPGDKVTVAVRPEKVTLHPVEGHGQAEATDPATVVLPGRLHHSVYIGTDMRHVVHLGETGAEIVVRAQNLGHRSEQRFHAGQAVTVRWAEDQARILRD
ncbi:MAG: ABC transporter ATP-binding protein [Anaerolineae bacterium]|nr:ABC transporter ATP-binding protein [Anaerolineae bacterium]